MAKKQKASKEALEISKLLQTLFSPIKIYHYGSRVSGKSSSESDFDFVVVVKMTNKSRWDNHELAREAIFSKLNLIADVWVYTEKDFNNWKDDFSSIPETAVNTGVELRLG